MYGVDVFIQTYPRGRSTSTDYGVLRTYIYVSYLQVCVKWRNVLSLPKLAGIAPTRSLTEPMRPHSSN